jgi:hypothetical protein
MAIAPKALTRASGRSLQTAAMLLVLPGLLGAAAPPVPGPTLAPLPSPQRVLGLVRAKFRSHRPPPPYVTYTLVRAELTQDGQPNYPDTYTYHIWCRNLDRAALGRKVFRAPMFGPLEFLRPAFNEPRDPGPPTADVFEPAPIHPHPVEFVPTPEPDQKALQVIGSVTVTNEFDYRVESMTVDGGEIHLNIVPTRDPERNRLREIVADRSTLEVHKLVATDRLFVGKQSYATIFTISMAMLEGRPVVTSIHGEVFDGYIGDGQKVDYQFKDIKFPDSLPAWYFDAHTSASHQNDAPE